MLKRARSCQLQIAKTLELVQAQSTAVISLWGSYEARMSRVLETRMAVNQRMFATMPNGYMGHDFAVMNTRVNRPILVCVLLTALL